MIRSRIRRLELARPEPLCRLSETELETRLAAAWAALSEGAAPFGDVEGLIRHLGPDVESADNAEYARFLRRHAWVFDHQTSGE